MTDKVQKIRKAVEKRYEYWKEKESNSHGIESEIRMSECQHLLLMLDSMQEEPTIPDIVDEHWWEMLGEEPMSEDLEKKLDKYIKTNFTIDKEQLDRFGIEEKDYMYSMDRSDMLEMVSYFVNWQKQKYEKIITDIMAVAYANGMAQMKKMTILEEPVSDIWHDASEEPKEGFTIVVYMKDDSLKILTSWGENGDFCIGEGFWYNIHQQRKWAYVDDLLNLSNVQRTVKDCKEPVSEELEDAAITYNKKVNFVVIGNVPNEHFIAGAKWGKQQTITKACDWLKRNADSYTWYNEFEGESGVTEDFVDDFKKEIQ